MVFVFMNSSLLWDIYPQPSALILLVERQKARNLLNRFCRNATSSQTSRCFTQQRGGYLFNLRIGALWAFLFSVMNYLQGEPYTSQQSRDQKSISVLIVNSKDKLTATNVQIKKLYQLQLRQETLLFSKGHASDKDYCPPLSNCLRLPYF